MIYVIVWDNGPLCTYTRGVNWRNPHHYIEGSLVADMVNGRISTKDCIEISYEEFTVQLALGLIPFTNCSPDVSKKCRFFIYYD